MGMQSVWGFDPRPCDCCDQVEVEGQWWFLRNYYGISGYFCPKCYDKVDHDSYKQPTNPTAYNEIRVRQELERNR